MMADTASGLLPFRSPYGERILAGVKTIELRTRRLNKWGRIYIYQAGGDKLITGRFDIASYYMASSDPTDEFLAAVTMTRHQFELYARGRATFAHTIYNVVRYDTPVTWPHTAPQSIRTLPDEVAAQIDQVGQQSQLKLTTGADVAPLRKEK